MAAQAKSNLSLAPLSDGLKARGVPPQVADELAGELNGVISKASKEVPRWVYLLFLIVMTYGGTLFGQVSAIIDLPQRADKIEQRLGDLETGIKELKASVDGLKK